MLTGLLENPHGFLQGNQIKPPMFLGSDAYFGNQALFQGICSPDVPHCCTGSGRINSVSIAQSTWN